jgi:putative hydrolase of HD superfamily
MILVHDLVEAIAGDVPFFETGTRKAGKAAREAAAIDAIRDRIGGAEGHELHELWHAFEDGRSPEAKVAHALDHLEVQIQHNLAELSTWEPVEYGLIHTKMVRPCAFDPFLAALAARVTAKAEAKIRAAGIAARGAPTSPAP